MKHIISRYVLKKKKKSKNKVHFFFIPQDFLLFLFPIAVCVTPFDLEARDTLHFFNLLSQRHVSIKC